MLALDQGGTRMKKILIVLALAVVGVVVAKLITGRGND